MVAHKYRYYLHTRVESGYFLQVQLGFWAGVFAQVALRLNIFWHMFWLPIFWLKGQFLKFELSKIWPSQIGPLKNQWLMGQILGPPNTITYICPIISFLALQIGLDKGPILFITFFYASI